MPTADHQHHPARFVRRRVGPRRGARATAIAALAFGVAGWALVVVGVLDNLALVVVLALLAPLFLGATFTAMTSLGPRRVVGIVAAVATGLGVLAAIIAWNLERTEGWRFEGLVGLGALAVAGLLARHALTIPPPAGHDLDALAGGPRVTRHPVLIVNLRSGGGKAQACGLVERCKELEIETVVLEEGLDLEKLARDAVARGADALGMAGGDGSLRCVAEVAVEHDLPFVCVPAGTRNHFALDLGLDRDDPNQALAAFLDGEERRVDYGTVNGEMFLNNVSLGMYAAVVEQESYRDAKLETVLGLIPTLFNEGGPWFDLHFDVPDHERLEESALVQVSNNEYLITGEVGRRKRLDGGELGVVTVDPKRLGDLVGLTMLAAARRPEWSSVLWTWTTPAFEIESGQSQMPAGLDGETVALDTPLRFVLVPQGLRVLVPRGTRVGLSEQHLGAEGTYSGLLEVAFGLGGSDD